MAQKKHFTIDDLIPGGSTYRTSSVPENKYYEWWGNTLIELGVDECINITKKDPIEEESGTIIKLDRINEILQDAGKKPIRHFYDAKFPYPHKPYICLTSGNSKILINTSAKDIKWSSDIDARATNLDWNKNSLCTAYVIDHNLYVETSNGTIHQISKDGSTTLTYGESVHRDEFGISKGTFWDPAGKKLAFYRMDQSMVSQYPQVNITPYDDSQVYEGRDSASISSRCATIEPDPYPMAGEAMHKVSIGIYDIATKSTVYLKTADPTDRYFTNIAWTPSGENILVMEINRDQTHGELNEYNPTTGEKLRTIFTEDDDKYFEPMHPVQFLPWELSTFVYLSRRDGFRHIYLVDYYSGKHKQLTKGKFEIDEILGFNNDSQSIFFTSNEQDALQKNIYKVNSKGKRTLLGNSTGWHNPTLAPSGDFILDNYSSPIIPRHIDVINTYTCQTTNIHTSKDPWCNFETPEIKVGSIKAADGVTDLFYRLILPVGFDPAKKYPAVVYVYGGPHAHNIDASRNWGARGWDIWMAEKGYVMFCLDNRGSERRGLDFEQATFRKLGVEEMRDQLKGVDFLKSLPYVDANRLGVHGWSFGGFMTSSLMTSFTDAETDNPYMFKGECPFKVGVAGGPVIDWKFYEVMYGERYMDTPQTNPEGYKYTSLLNKAQNLKGRLMVIYGGNDPTCVPQHTLSFMRACIDAGTYPDLFTYPGDGHNMFGTDRIHLHNVITRYFEDHLK